MLHRVIDLEKNEFLITIYNNTFGDQLLPAKHAFKRVVRDPDDGVLVQGFARVGRKPHVLSPLQVRLQDPERKPVQRLQVSVLQLRHQF